MIQALPLSAMRVWAYDFRGHGHTTVQPEQDWSLATLVADTRELLRSENLTSPLFLVGHSLGGCVAARVAASLPAVVRGLVVLDAVEGVALSSLEAGLKFINDRPTKFHTEDEAVQWSLTAGPLHGAYSAKLSIPDQLTWTDEGFAWRTNLAATVPFWNEWFTGLSSAFLAAPCSGKLLLLAGVEKLDTPLAAGHMMGKYQLVVLASVRAGHFVHEDAPGQTASAIALFVNRYAASSAAAGLSAEEVLAASSRRRA
jgi:protein phosphatase methylesterase 1